MFLIVKHPPDTIVNYVQLFHRGTMA